MKSPPDNLPPDQRYYALGLLYAGAVKSFDEIIEARKNHGKTWKPPKKKDLMNDGLFRK